MFDPMEYLKEILHDTAQVLLVPTIIVLMLLIVATILIIGSLIVEIIFERRHFRLKISVFLKALQAAESDEVVAVIDASGLLKNQRRALIEIYENRDLPDDMRMALADRLLKEQDDDFAKRVGRTNLIARISPMLGLMATLIPLGPGIVAMGQGDIVTLSSSLMVAFDATVAGIVVSVVGLAVSALRKRWYSNYANALKNASATILRKIDDMEYAAYYDAGGAGSGSAGGDGGSAGSVGAGGGSGSAGSVGSAGSAGAKDE